MNHTIKRNDLNQSVNGWEIDNSRTNITDESVTIQYRKQINGQRYIIFIENEGSDEYGAILNNSSRGPHTEPIRHINTYDYSQYSSLRDIVQKCHGWMENDEISNC